MDLQFSEHYVLAHDCRKFSQNTCDSETRISPDSEPGRHHHFAFLDSLKAFSPTTPSCQAEQSPQKAFLTVSIPTLPSLQNQTHLPNINITLAQNPVKASNKHQSPMEQETTAQNLHKTEQIDSLLHSGKENQDRGLIEAIIKSELLTRQNLDLKYCQKKNLMPGYNSSNRNKNHNTLSYETLKSPLSNSPPTQKDTRPLPTYLEARPALYVWIRNLCRQMNMCFDVLALAMKYLDEYHITYQNAYDRSTFTVTAYTMIILASKLINKEILTPKTIAQKIKVSQTQLQALQMKIILMMNFKLYFDTYARNLQGRLQKWEEICQRMCLKEELSFFGKNIFAFKRFTFLIKEVEFMAKGNIEISQEMLLAAFIKSLAEQFKKEYRAERLLAEILTSVFSELSRQVPAQFSFDKILQKIESEMDSENDNIWEEAQHCFEQRNNFFNYNKISQGKTSFLQKEKIRNQELEINCSSSRLKQIN